MKVLFGCLFYQSLSGSELYVYELTKKLSILGHEIIIVSENIGGEISDLSKKNGIEVYNLLNLPDNQNFDIIHCQHYPITNFLIDKFPNVPKVCTIHSEVIELENPIIHQSIKKYIVVRPSIKKHLIDEFGIASDNIIIIYNPIDEIRFNKFNTKSENYVLFVGTIENLRKKTLFNLVEYTKNFDKELWIVGNNHSDYLSTILQNQHVKHFESTLEVGDFFKNCYETAGIMLGRTTIEGWMCGKSGWIYEINNKGEIESKKYVNPPNDITKFYSSNVVLEIENVYKNILI